MKKPEEQAAGMQRVRERSPALPNGCMHSRIHPLRKGRRKPCLIESAELSDYLTFSLFFFLFHFTCGHVILQYCLSVRRLFPSEDGSRAPAHVRSRKPASGSGRGNRPVPQARPGGKVSF
jgi:hypothetical protein